MKKQILFMYTASLIMLTSCSSSNNSAPQVKTEIYGSVTTDPETVDENKKENVTLTYAVYGQVDTDEYELIKRFNEADNGYVIATKDYSEIIGADEHGQIVYDADKQCSLNIMIMQDISDGKIDIVRDYYLGGSQNMNILSERDLQ